ncbi:MAG: hypothetical protein ABL996_02800 [Micropepsaceae bacterium]
MPQAERYAWFSLAAWAAILFFLLTRFTAGLEVLGQSFGLTVVEQSAGRLLWTYVTLAVIAIVAESVIAGVLSARAGKTDIEKDERDLAIEVKANLASYWFTAAALNVIVIHVLANAAYGGHDLPKLNLTSLTGVAFALLLVLTLAEIVKRVAVIWNYRLA